MSFLSRVGGPVLLPRQDVSSESFGTGRQSPYATAKVIDFYPDPRILTDVQKSLIKKSVEFGSLVDRMPINSIWCQVIGAGRLDQHIAYPFFPPHLCLPLKPSEEVWVVYDGVMYYWMCRRVGDYQSEDINYTFVARAANPDPGKPTGKDLFNNRNLNVNSYPTGNTDSVYDATLATTNTDDNIIKNSASYQTGFVPEAIPRLVRNPGDFIIQGSNNSSIKLGTSSNQQSSGIVDIVAGHNLKTQPVLNTRNNQEVNKSLPASQDSPTDLSLDKTRVYLSMNDNPDVNFSIYVDGITQSGTGASAVVKSDQVRLIARNDIKITVGDTGAGIVIKSNGEIVIVPAASSVIKLGGDDADKAILCQTATQVIPGNVTAAPVISTAGGIIGASTIAGTGLFASKILVK